MPREPQQTNPTRNAEIHAQDMHENVYVVDCCVFCSYPPQHRPPMRAKFRPASSFLCVIFPPTKLVMCFEFFNRTFALTKLQCVQIGESSMTGSNLPFIPEILRGKGRLVGDFRVFPCFAALKARTTARRRQEKCLKMQPGPPPKAGTSPHLTGSAMLIAGIINYTGNT